jgi:hypothetical protein
MIFVPNPIDGRLVPVFDTEEIAVECASTDNVYEFMYISGATTPGGLYSVSKADVRYQYKMPAVGILMTKYSLTQGLVIMRGVVDVPGIVAGTRYFLGTNSQVTDTPPPPTLVPTFVQVLGVGIGTNKLYVNPGQELILRKP